MLHIVLRADNGTHARCCCALTSSTVCKFDGIVIIAGALLLLRYDLAKSVEMCLESAFFDKVCITLVQARVSIITRDVQSTESKIGINTKEQPM